MGVDMHVTIEVQGCDDEGDYRSDVCEMFVGRWYHWDSLTPDLLGHRYMGTFDFAQLKRRKDSPIFEGTVKDTMLYLIMKALAGRFGKRSVRAKWKAE